MGRKRNYKKQEVLDAIKNSYGIMSDIAKRLKCNWHTADEYEADAQIVAEECYTFPAKQMYNTVNDKIFYVYGEIEDED